MHCYNQIGFHRCVKIARIWSFSGPHIPYLSAFSSNVEKYGPQKLQIRTLFSQCIMQILNHKPHNCFCPYMETFDENQKCIALAATMKQRKRITTMSLKN